MIQKEKLKQLNARKKGTNQLIRVRKDFPTEDYYVLVHVLYSFTHSFYLLLNYIYSYLNMYTHTHIYIGNSIQIDKKQNILNRSLFFFKIEKNTGSFIL